MTAAITIENLSFGYGRGTPLLSEVSVDVAEGEVCSLLGPNGAGKTTLLRCVLGLLTPRGGTIRVGDTDATRLSRRELAQQVAYVPQATTTVFPFSALDMVVMGRTPHVSAVSTPSASDRRAAAAVLEEFGIGELAGRPFAVLSGGERRLVLLARAVVQDSPILVLDEPTSALDFGNEATVLELVRALAAAGRTVLMTTHQPAHVLTCGGTAVLLRNGHIVATGPAAEVVTAARLSELYGVEVQILTGSADAYACVPVLREALPTPGFSFRDRL